MQNAFAVLPRKCKTRNQTLEEANSTECISGCEGSWYTQAKETFKLNQISVDEFSKSLFENKRRKYWNHLLAEHSNCGKTFILKPLTNIYNCFQTPTTDLFSWASPDKAEFVFLNAFHWYEKAIPWGNFLNLLEEENIHISIPKKTFCFKCSMYCWYTHIWYIKN